MLNIRYIPKKKLNSSLILLLIILTLATVSHTANASRPIVADAFPRKINIDHNFTGIDILLYGIKNESGDLVIVVRGPRRDFTFRKKGKVGNLIWTNVENVDIKDFYSFYYISSMSDVAEIDNQHLLSQLEIGDNLLKNSKYYPDITNENDRKELAENLSTVMQQRGSIDIRTEEIFFWGQSLFRTFVHFPKNIVKGSYNIDVYLFDGGVLKSFQSMPIFVEKVGLEAFVYKMAHESSLLYGLTCVFIALFLGALSSILFGRK